MGSEITQGRSTRADAAVGQRHLNPALMAGIALWGMAAFYMALIVFSQLDGVFLPGNEFSVPGINLPGVDKPPDAATPEGRINILVMGLDLRRDEDPDTPARTDSVFILSIEPVTKTAGILSIPRDMMMDIPDGEGGYIPDRINTAYERGELRKEGSGPDVAIETVEHNLDIPIDYYAVLNFNNFIEIVDELGGIDVDVPEYIYDPAYNDCKYCDYYPVEFLPGPQHMDGETALAYARLRKSDNDFKRIERQQLVMRAIARKAASLDWLTRGKALSLYGKYKDAVKTNISDFRLGGLAILGGQVGIDNIRMESLAEATYPCPYSVCGGAAILLSDPAKVEEIKNRIFGDPEMQAEGAVIRIMNGTQTPDLAEQFAAYLRLQGIPDGKIIVDEEAGGNLYDNTLVINLDKKDVTSGKLAGWLRLPNTRVKTAADLAPSELAQFQDGEADIVVVLGADARVPATPTPTYRDPGYNDYYDGGGTYAPVETPTPEPVIETPEPEPEITETPEPAPTDTPEPEPTDTPLPVPSETPAEGGA